jgi:Phosphotransferase enzyme family
VKLRSSVRSCVYRYPLLDGPPEALATVIVKCATQPYGATAAGAIDGSVWQDWAGMLLIAASPGDPIAPHCYGGQAAGLIVLEDLGDGPSLRDVMAGGDGQRAEEGLVDYLATLGKLHARTHDRYAQFQDIRASLGLYHSKREWYPHRYAQLSQQFYAMLHHAQVAPAPGVGGDLAIILKTLRSPNLFATYIHGDPTPSNCLLARPGLRLIDFEYGSYGHALLDGVQARMCFPSGPFVNRIPARIARCAEAAYRAELARGCPAAADDTLFAQAVAVACAYWAIGFLSWLTFAELLAADRQWGSATVRQRVILFAELFAQTAEEAAYLEALGTTFQSLAARLRKLWPEAAEMPLYPAFCGSV